MRFSNNDVLFSEYYEKYANYIYKIGYMYLKNSHDAEEAVQHAFSKLYTYKKEFDTEEHVKAWLIRVTSNYCKNELKHWWKIKREDFDITNVITYNRENDKTDIKNKVMNLPEKYKLPIVLFYYDGYDIKTISSIINKNENTVKTLLKRGKEKLKFSLESEEKDYEK